MYGLQRHRDKVNLSEKNIYGRIKYVLRQRSPTQQHHYAWIQNFLTAREY